MSKAESKRIIVMTAVAALSLSLFSHLGYTYARAGAVTEGPEPQVFAEGTVSTGHEFALTFTPDMKEAYFTRTFPDKKINHIMRTELKDGRWQGPTLISFSNDQWSDLDPALSPDGRRLFFVSTRPAPGAQDTKSRNMDIWYADRSGRDWGQPQYLEHVNSPGKEGSPTVSEDSTLCFFSDRGRAANANSIYCSELRKGGYSEPKKLGPEINSETSDTSPFLSADGNTLLFYSTRPGGYGQADLYVSFRRNHQWSPAKNLGPIVNTGEWEYNPVVSPDGKILYFGRKGSIYWIPVEALKIPGLDAKHLRH
jgi:dipeptidyl aminopeptidase/acylaminoacyl peptidase